MVKNARHQRVGPEFEAMIKSLQAPPHCSRKPQGFPRITDDLARFLRLKGYDQQYREQRKNNRRGMILDLMTFIISMFVLSIFMLTMYIAWSEIDDAFQDNPSIPTTEQDFFHTQATNYTNGADNIFLSIFIAVVIGIMILSYFISSTPIVFWPVWIVTTILALMAGYLANAFAEFTSEGVLFIAASAFPKMGYILNHYLHFIAAISLLMLLVYFARPAGQGATL